jgi:hypothetical protein
VSTLVYGVDPGVTTGVANVLLYRGRVLFSSVYQAAGENLDIGEFLFQDYDRLPRDCTALVSMERFVDGKGAGPDADVTRRVIEDVTRWSKDRDVELVDRPAHAIKRWAGADERIEKIGATRYIKGMPHARDALKHALFLGVQRGLLIDPLSKEY